MGGGLGATSLGLHMKLYKFRPLINDKHFCRIKKIINNGFYCCDFLSFNDMYEGVFTINYKNSKIDISDKLKYKICSFSGENALNSQLMWGHYASAGMGVVIEVNVGRENCHQIMQVRYENSTDNLNSIESILTRKSKEWRYEDEFRFLSKEPNDEVKVGNIDRIYFGTPYEKLANYNDIKIKHENLIIYLKFKDTLKKFCEEKNILCQDYKFK
jgi:hypothetical protein